MLIDLVSEVEVSTADDCSLDLWVAELVDALLLDVATPPFSSSSDAEDCWVVGATVDLLEVGALVEEMVETVAVEGVTDFLVEVEDCLLEELTELEEETDVADDEVADDEVADDEVADDDVADDDSTDDDLAEDDVAEDEVDDDLADDVAEDEADDDVAEDDVAEELETLPPLAKAAKSSCACSYLP